MTDDEFPDLTRRDNSAYLASGSISGEQLVSEPFYVWLDSRRIWMQHLREPIDAEPLLALIIDLDPSRQLAELRVSHPVQISGGTTTGSAGVGFLEPIKWLDLAVGAKVTGAGASGDTVLVATASRPSSRSWSLSATPDPAFEVDPHGVQRLKVRLGLSSRRDPWAAIDLSLDITGALGQMTADLQLSSAPLGMQPASSRLM